jgi:hypothetical protein|tara:strand:- start:320 stop:583 length:264 start_codon:yes stop_codon:yes gene_type:complete
MSYKWINARERHGVPKRQDKEPKIDGEVSKAVGRKVYVNDPQVIKTLAKVKQERASKGKSDNTPDNFLQDSNVVKELKQALGVTKEE